ncbi:MAG: hypothetical protein E7612_02575 [Ruminococcaceae bacterium]|nr:hypothetical protein [Oscillospiraceae bacterium]
MQDLKDYFSYSAAEEIMPDITFSKSGDSLCRFALILDSCETISKQEISEIEGRTQLSPLFLDISRDSKHTEIRSYARSLGAPVIHPDSKEELFCALNGCCFSISEDIKGAVFSFLCDTPSYVNAGDARCRKFLGESARWDISSEIIIPYTKNRTANIRRPLVYKSDFSLAKNKFRTEISAEFKRVFID